MFIRYKCNRGKLFFFDKDRNLISGEERNLGSLHSLWTKDNKYICYFYFEKNFNVDENSLKKYDIKNYKLNQEYEVIRSSSGPYKITFLARLQKEEECGYNYGQDNENNWVSLFECLEGPNYIPNEGDSLFREEYYKGKEKENIYLSKYVTDYYPALSVSPPSFFKTGRHPINSQGKAAIMYNSFRTDSKIPFTLFLKPHTRQWFNEGISLTKPGTYTCTYNYNTRELLIEWTEYDASGNAIPKQAPYTNVPHTITVCCQGAGGGGEKGHLWSWAGRGGSAGGFIAANCFLGNNITKFEIQVGAGGSSNNSGQSSYVQIEQTINLRTFASEKNPTLAYYNPDYEYTKLENTLKIEGEGGGVGNNGGNGKIIANTTGWYKNNNMIETPGGEEGNKASSFLRSLFFKPLFCLKGGGGGKGGYGDTKYPTDGGKSYFTSFNNFLNSSSNSSEEDVIMTWKDNDHLSLEKSSYSYNKDESFESPLILEGPSLAEALYFLTNISIGFYDGGLSFKPEYTADPSGGGGGSSIFGKGGYAGHANSSKDGANGALGAGGGGGKADGTEPGLGNGGKGGDGAVWLIW